MSSQKPVILVVEDEPELADLYATWLRESWPIRIAYSGSQAIEAMDEDVAIVLLDRRMPGLSGDEVLDTIRERELECRVAMVTAVEPDWDIIELGFDDYLVKPVTKEDLKGTVKELLLRSTYDEQMREFFALASKKAVLEEQKLNGELEDDERYQQLRYRLTALRDTVDEMLSELSDHETYARLCYEISRHENADEFTDDAVDDLVDD